MKAEIIRFPRATPIGDGTVEAILADKVLETLPQLRYEDLVFISKCCEALLSHISVETTGDEDWLLASIIEELRDRGLSYTIPDFFKVKKQNAYNGYLRKSEEVRKGLTDALPGLQKVQYYALGRACAKALAECLQINQYQLSLDVMLRHVEDVPLALEEFFPGYVMSGLLSLLLKPAKGWVE